MPAEKPESRQAPPGGVADVAGWVGAAAVADRISDLGEGLSQQASEAAQRAVLQAQRLISIEESGETLAKVVSRWEGTSADKFAGRIFEWHHSATFNAHAAASPLHALITEFPDHVGITSDPHSPVDVGVVDAAGNWLEQAQAKVLGQTSQRLWQLSQDKYEGLRLLVPSDHKVDTETKIQIRIDQASPGFLKQKAYESVQDRLTDRLSVDGVESDPITNDQLRQITRDPQRHLDQWKQREENLRAEALDEQQHKQSLADAMSVASVAGAAIAGGASAAAMTAMIRSVSHIAAVRSGQMTPTAAAMSAAGDASAAFVRGALVGGGGQSIALLGEHLGLPDALGGGTLPFAIARAAVALGETSVAYARGDIDATQAAQRSAGAVSRISVAWAGALIGQIIIPVPVVGAMIGGTVGSLCCGIAAQGIAAVTSEMHAAGVAEEILAATQVELAATLIVLDEQLRLIDQISHDWETAFATQVLPSLDTLEQAVPAGDAIASLQAVTELIQAYQGAPLFTTPAEFDAWMLSHEPLVLKTNPQR